MTTQLLRGLSSGIRTKKTTEGDAPDDSVEWIKTIFPRQFSRPLALHHKLFWNWTDDIEFAEPYEPDENVIFCLAREGGKSMTAEAATVKLAAKGQRKTFGYCCATLKQANDHISAIARRLESRQFARYYPEHSARRVYKYTKGSWSQSRLATEGGAMWVAIGLDAANRGFRPDDMRIDCLVLDDVDDRLDSKTTVLKKISTISNTILPIGSQDMVTMFIQNVIHANSVMKQTLDRKIDILSKRLTIGPIPALEGAEFESREDPSDGVTRVFITKGKATWKGQDRKACQRYIWRYGFTSFKRECQHDVEDVEGALWTTELINRTRVGLAELPVDNAGFPVFKRIVVGVDPSGGRAEIGIVAAGLSFNGHCYVLRDSTQPGSAGPGNWARATVLTYDELEADKIVAEKNFGGDLVSSNIGVYYKHAPVKMVTASRGKAVRAEPVSTLYEKGLVHHVGAFPKLEAEMTSWVPGVTEESPNRIDALVWAITELMLEKKVFTGGAGVIRVNRR